MVPDEGLFVSDGGVPVDRGTSTSASLLARVRAEQPDPDAWRRFVDLYEPLIRGWCRASGLQSADAEDIGQEVFKAVAAGIGRFVHGRDGGTLRGWLRRITSNELATWARRRNHQPVVEGGSDALRTLTTVPNAPDADDPDRDLTREEKRALLRRAVLGSMTRFSEQSREIFCRVVVDREAPAHVAEAMSVSVDVVYTVRSRVLKRLRDEYGELLELDGR